MSGDVVDTLVEASLTITLVCLVILLILAASAMVTATALGMWYLVTTGC